MRLPRSLPDRRQYRSRDLGGGVHERARANAPVTVTLMATISVT
jgi:hypothetical protein